MREEKPCISVTGARVFHAYRGTVQVACFFLLFLFACICFSRGRGFLHRLIACISAMLVYVWCMCGTAFGDNMGWNRTMCAVLGSRSLDYLFRESFILGLWFGIFGSTGRGWSGGVYSVDGCGDRAREGSWALGKVKLGKLWVEMEMVAEMVVET